MTSSLPVPAAPSVANFANAAGQTFRAWEGVMAISEADGGTPRQHAAWLAKQAAKGAAVSGQDRPELTGIGLAGGPGMMQNVLLIAAVVAVGYFIIRARRK